MMYCPRCSLYYHDDSIRCTTCLQPLVHITLNENELQSMELTYLTTASSELEANMLEQLLRNNDVQVVKKYREAGDYLSIYMGDTSFGIDLYVDQEQLNYAKTILPKNNNKKQSTINKKGKNVTKRKSLKTIFIIVCIITIIIFSGLQLH